MLDFGIMKATHRVSQTESGTVKGSVGFMSPEQARGKAVDHRSDLYSTGLVILYAATGEPTFPGETFYDLLTAAATGLGDEQLARIAALPEPLPAILGRALDVDPDRRFQSGAEFRAAVASAPDRRRRQRAGRAAAQAVRRRATRRAGTPGRRLRPRATPESMARLTPITPRAGEGGGEGS